MVLGSDLMMSDVADAGAVDVDGDAGLLGELSSALDVEPLARVQRPRVAAAGGRRARFAPRHRHFCARKFFNHSFPINVFGFVTRRLVPKKGSIT